MPSIKYSLPKNQLRRLTTFKARQESAPSSATDPGACEILVDPQAGNFDPSSCTYNAFHFGNWTDTASTPTSGTRDTTSQYPYRVYLKLFGGLGTYDHGTGHGFSGTGEYPPLLTANNGYMHTGASYSGSIPLYRSSHQLEYINDVVDVQVATQKIKRTVLYQGSAVYENTITLPVHLRYVQLMGDSKYGTTLSCLNQCILRFEYGTPSYSGDIDSNGNRDTSYTNPVAGQAFPSTITDFWEDTNGTGNEAPSTWPATLSVNTGGFDLFEDATSVYENAADPVWAVNEYPFDLNGDYWALKNKTYYSPQYQWNTVHQYAESNTSIQCVFNVQGAVGGRFAAAPESPAAAFYLKQYALLNSNYTGSNTWPSYWNNTTGTGNTDLQTIGMFQDLHWVSELNFNPTTAELEAGSAGSSNFYPSFGTTATEAIMRCVHRGTTSYNKDVGGTIYSDPYFGVRRPFVLVPGGVYTNSSDWMPHWRNKDSASTQTGTVNMIGVGIEIEETA
jgi:hypothetical protein